MTQTRLTPLSGALNCAARGWRVFPLIVGGKKPAFEGWQDWATTNQDQIRRYANENPNANWGVYAGASGLLIVDLDRKAGVDGEASFLTLEARFGALPSSFRVRSPSGGLHIYCKGRGPNSTSKIGPGIDTRGQGGYVVAPGSVTPQGDYIVERDDPVCEVPAWVLEQLETKKEALSRPDDSCVPGSISEGNRDHELTRWAGVLRGQGLTVKELEIALLAVNAERCSPPLEESQVLKIARSIGKKPRGEARAAADFASIDVQEALETSAPKHISQYSGATPTRKWVVADWIPAGEITSMYGGGSVGKSLLSLQLAIALGTGGKWLGLDCRKMPVLYVACEDTDDEIHIRRDRMLDHPEYEFSRESILQAPVYLWSRVGAENDLAVEVDSDVVPGRFLPVLEQAIRNLGARELFLILDTVSDVYLGSENIREKVNKFLKTILGRLRLDLNLTILVLAHPSRTGQNTGDNLSGSTAWENAVRSRLTVHRHKELPGVTVLTRAKSNYSAVGDQISMKYDGGRFIPVSTPTDDEQAAARDLGNALELVCTIGDNPLARVAKSISEGVRTSHLFGGASWRTLERRVLDLLKEPQKIGKNVYEAVAIQQGKIRKRYVRVAELQEGPATLLALYQ